MIIKFINQVQRSLKAQILKIRTDNGTEFKNEKLQSLYAKLGIVHHTSTARTPQQNGVVERRNRTLVEVARTMLIFSKTPEFLWAEAIATTCFTHNRSLVHTWYNKTPYELLRGRKPNVQYFHVFGSLCYPTNDHDDLGKMKLKAEIDNSAVDTLDNEDTRSSSLIIVEDSDAPQIVTSSEEPIIQESTILFEEAESSSNYQDPSNMHKFHQHRYTNKWTKNNPIEQVIGDPSKPVQTRNRLQTDAEVCMYALTVSLIKPKKSRKLCLIIAG
ncbi:retrovirus-related pol polyprotein from transposon TNT 1-94 [Tanacetum coccineum]